jgi:putative DNA primase/helicase
MDGKRYLSASETKMGKQLNEAQLKQLTGGDIVSARFMRGDFFDFRATGKIHLTTNHKPHVSDDDATWRRIHPIPWEQHVSAAVRNKQLSDELFRYEASGILNRALEGLADWLATSGLHPPAMADMAKSEYRAAEDQVAQFISEQLTVDMDNRTSHQDNTLARIYEAYGYWMKSGGSSPMSRNALSEALAKRGYRKMRNEKGVTFPQLCSATLRS